MCNNAHEGAGSGGRLWRLWRLWDRLWSWNHYDTGRGGGGGGEGVIGDGRMGQEACVGAQMWLGWGEEEEEEDAMREKRRRGRSAGKP